MSGLFRLITSPWLYITGAVLGVGVLVAVWFVTEPVAESAQEFLSLMTEERYHEAYDRLANGAVPESPDQFAEAVAHAGLSQAYAVSWNRREINGDSGYVEGLLLNLNDTRRPVSIELVQEHGVWKIWKVDLLPSFSEGGTGFATLITWGVGLVSVLMAAFSAGLAILGVGHLSGMRPEARQALPSAMLICGMTGGIVYLMARIWLAPVQLG